MAGRPPKPTKLKLLDGNPGRRPIPVETEVATGVAVKPAWVAIDPSWSAVWDELAPQRTEMDLLNASTQDAFGQLCQFLAAARKGPGTLDGAQLTHMRTLMNAFGFDPSSQTKLGIRTKSKGASENPFTKLG